MRIQLNTDGGLVYFPPANRPITVDTDELPPEEARELERLVEAAGFFDMPAVSEPPRGAADVIRYTISISSPERSHTVSFTDPVEDPDVQALLEYLETKAGEPGTTP